MLRLISYATHQQSQEMSFLRRLYEYSRLFLRNRQVLYNRTKAGEIERKGTLRIQGQGQQGRQQLGPRATSELSGAEPPSAWTKIGQQIHSHVRQIFINNVLRRATVNQEVARKAAQRLLYGDSRPFFALVGVSLATGSVGVVSRDNEIDGICWEIRESITKQIKERRASSEERDVNSVQDLRFGPLLNQGCNAAVYAANYNDSTDVGWPFAVKMMFNYDIESNAFAILKNMVREIVPARKIDLKNLSELDQGLFTNVRRCPVHPNVIAIHHAFVDTIPLLPHGLESYPSALPSRLNPENGCGRNMSLFLVMKRYDVNLREFLLKSQVDLSYRTRLLIMAQLLSAVAHLEQNQIAHRDLKGDNVLMDLSQGEAYPEVVISDFGCCLADKTHGMYVPFRTHDTDRGGNPALCPPEISTAVPGKFKYLNYQKADAWTVGAITYEVFGNPNPFYGKNGSSRRLDSRTYTEDDLPVLENANVMVQNLVRELLNRSPDKRLSAEQAFNIVFLLLYAPSEWMSRSKGRCPNDDEILQWIVCLTTKVLCHTDEQLEFRIIRNFLRKVKFSTLKSATMWVVRAKEEP